MSERLQLATVVTILIVLGLGLTLYKHFSLGFPLLPGEVTQAWTAEARISFESDGDDVEISFALPQSSSTLRILDQYSASSAYQFKRVETDDRPRAVWKGEGKKGKQVVYYQVVAFEGQGASRPIDRVPPTGTDKPDLKPAYLAAAKDVVSGLKKKASDPVAFATNLIQALAASNPDENVRFLLGVSSDANSRTRLAVDLINLSGTPARIARGISLEDGRRREKLSDLVEVWTGRQWQDFAEKATLVDFSIYTLPINQQNIFKLLLLVPIGTLVVVLMRSVVGVRTSGTFMPILIALAFKQTELLSGLIMFIVVVGIGLVIRAYLSRLNLLLVPRISAVVIVVIILFAGVSIASYKLGIEAGLTVTFFPMIIMAWTIERMSVLWEEDGAREALVQGGGSLAVAVLVYLTMSIPLVAYLTFSFPELLLVVLAVTLMLGHYTGYRLTELRRFAPMVHE